MSKSYLPIRVKTLQGELTLGFDLYIKLPHKTLLYVRGEDDIEIERIERLKVKKVRKLYIVDEQEPQYQAYIDRTLDSVMQNDNISMEEKSGMVVAAGEATAERIYEDPESKKSYLAAQNTTMNLINVLGQNDDLLKGIFDRKVEESEDGQANYDAKMQKHSVNTSSMAISFGEYLKFPKAVVECLGVAGLYHDIGYKVYEDKSLFFKKQDELSNDELVEYRKHPTIGADLLKEKEFANQDIVNMILTHEERKSGDGFPNQITNLELPQEVLALCAYYDRCVTIFGMSMDETFDNIKIDQVGAFDLNLINKFKSFIKKAGLKSS